MACHPSRVGILGLRVQDLYACALRFDGDPGVVFDAVLDRVQTWIGKTYGDPEHLLKDLDGEWSPEADDEVRWETITSPEGNAARCAISWRRPVLDEPGIATTVKCRVQRTATQAGAWFRVLATSTIRQVRPVNVPWSRPPVVRSLVHEQTVTADGRRLRDEPELLGARGVTDRLVPLLLSPDRSLPVVAITFPLDGHEPLIDADRTAGLLAGIAHVFMLRDEAATFTLSDELTKKRSVYDGAVRIYWPGFSRDADVEAHPLLQRRDIRELRAKHGTVSQALLQDIGRVAAMHGPETWLDRDFDLVQAQVRKRERKAARERLRGEGIGDETLRYIRELESANDEWVLEAERLQADTDELRARTVDLEADLQGVYDELRRRTQAARASGPSSVYEAVRFAQDDCRRLVFLPEAFDSAQDSPYQQPDKVYEAFVRMDDIAARYAADALPRGLVGGFEDIGLDFAHDISDTAKRRYLADYKRRVDGREVLLGPHVRIGAGSQRTMLRIYFAVDHDRRAFIVGHVGKHLRDAGHK